MSQIMNPSLSSHYQRLMLFSRRLQRRYKRLRHISTSELLYQVREAKSASQLTTIVNKLQSRVWNTPSTEQALLRDKLVDALSTQVLHASPVSLRLTAAQWLRSLTQAGMISFPQNTYVTLVTAAMKTSENTAPHTQEELRSYLHTILDCFLPFHYPYPAFTSEQFPSNTVFYPLVTLLSRASYDIQEFLLAIFAELPTLSEPEFADTLLPLALQWADHTDAKRRGEAAYILARIPIASAQVACSRLQKDSDAQVRSSAKHAMSYIRKT